MPVALLSVTDKSGLLELATELVDRGWTLLASGGTAAHLRAGGLTVIEVSDHTGAPEILGGRVKTLHPAIHGGILSRRSEQDSAELERFGWGPIDMVVANLYRFEETPDVEHIDIGGVTLLRAAAKNFEHVTVVCDVADYPRVLAELPRPDLETRSALAAKAFALTSRYDQAIADHFFGTSQLGPRGVPGVTASGQGTPRDPGQFYGQVSQAYPGQPLRYGENPHQRASLFGDRGPLGGRLLQGKELSYNNLLDGDAAWRGVESFSEPAVCVIKHASPCGLAVSEKPCEALRSALDSDRVSAFGGVIATNRPVDKVFAGELGDLFLECLLAPAFEPEALEILSARKNLRLLVIDPCDSQEGEVRTVRGGLLWQERDIGESDKAQWRVVTRRTPSDAEMDSLRFAWRACQHVRSNAIVLAAGRATVGIGGGQPNRADSLRIALQRAQARAAGSVLASDGFFPFPDSIELAAQAGVTALIQPGGSIRDNDSVLCADEHGLAMITTGRRHFRH